jgi:hypothetical protein
LEKSYRESDFTANSLFLFMLFLFISTSFTTFTMAKERKKKGAMTKKLKREDDYCMLGKDAAWNSACWQLHSCRGDL